MADNKSAETAPNNGAPAITPTPAANVSSSQLTEQAPVSKQFIGTVADVSNVLTKNNREYRIITFIDENGKSRTLAVSENFYLNNKARLAPDVTLSITTEDTIAGKTTWTDRETGAVSAHTATGTNIRNVVLATGNQAKMGLLGQLEDKLLAYAEQPALLNAMAQLYGSVLR